VNQHLCIAATFLTGRYHGNEWPPSPARLFQALVAGAKTGAYQRHWPDVEGALRMLEQLPAPVIVACKAEHTRPYRISVPNNDMDKAAREWAAGRPFNAALLRTMKDVQPWEIGCGQAGQPHVYYFWKLPEDARMIACKQLASFLHALGWGVDMAYADAFPADEQFLRSVACESAYSHYAPAPRGKPCPVPAPGYLDDLCNAYRRYCRRHTGSGVDAFTHAIKYGQQPYRRVGAEAPPVAVFMLRRIDNANAWFSFPWAFSMRVAAWMRHATAEALLSEGFNKEEVDAYALGHGDEGRRRHMSFVPVPSIGGPHTDGAVRRVMLVEPAGEEGSVSELLQWKLASSILHRLLESNGGPRKTAPACLLSQAAKSDSVFLRYLPSSKQLQWRSVTPVILHGHNSSHGKFSLKKTEELLYQAFENSGFQRQLIAEIQFQPAPFWPGTEGALAIRVPEHLNRWPRYHVSVRFHEPVAGPVLVGIGRHYGIGLFAAPDA
jgi:CRISPR-associated protein Csb2